jgi:DNA-binding transcriptional ArsR family regulator
MIPMRRNVWWLIAGSRGGENRARIIETLHDKPLNAHQLAEILNLDYKTIRHHLDLLITNQIIIPEGSGYGKIFFLTEVFDTEYNEFIDIRRNHNKPCPINKTELCEKPENKDERF